MNKEQIGSFIYNERKKQQLSQKALAEKAGITRYQQIIEIEKAQYDYGIDVLIKVTTALGFDIVLLDSKFEIASVDSKFDGRKVSPLVLDEVGMFDFSKVESAKEEEKTLNPSNRTNKRRTPNKYLKTKNKSHA